MAIQVSGVNVIDNERNANVGVLTATALNVPVQAISFNPADGASAVAYNSNIVITFNANLKKGSGNITLREDSASGTIIATIAVSSGAVSISGGVVTINPGDFGSAKDIYVVVDEGAFQSTSLNSNTALIDTYNFSTGPLTVRNFYPSDGATYEEVDRNIQIQFTESISKGSGNITLRAGSASGTIRQTIDVTSGAVTISGSYATINPPSNLEYSEDVYVVVDAGCFRNADGDAASANEIINTYNFSTKGNHPALGTSTCGGNVICATGGNIWVIASENAEVSRSWYQRSNAANRAQQVSGCSGWFVPTMNQMKNPGYRCRTYWDTYPTYQYYWTNTEQHSHRAKIIYSPNGRDYNYNKSSIYCVRAFRCVSY